MHISIFDKIKYGSVAILLCYAQSCRSANAPSPPQLAPNNLAPATQRVKNQQYRASLPADFILPAESDEVGWRILADYGAVYVARGGSQPPRKVILADAAETAAWQSALKTARVKLSGVPIELQQPAMAALLAAREEAHQKHLEISPRGADSGGRTYEETVGLWNSRVQPALAHWVAVRRLTPEDAVRLKALPIIEQVPEVLRLESSGIYFSKDFAKSILYSVAAPGSSQHIALLAFDIKEHENAAVRTILGRFGWYQTVASDLPHFTFLGVEEQQLQSLGLKPINTGGRTFWVPNLGLVSH